MIFTNCSGPSHMLKMGDAPQIQHITPEAGKAAIVVARTSQKGFNVEFFNYVDKRFIGVTKGKSYFVVKDIEPGKRIFISKASNIDALIIDFKPDKVYYIQQLVGFPEAGKLSAWFKPVKSPFEDVGVTLKEVTLAEMVKEINSDSTYYVVDVNNPGKDLTEEEYQNIASKILQ